MMPIRKSCVVAFPKECNHATSLSANATGCATVPQPASLKALAKKVLTRNQQCNRDATTRPTLPNWCNTSCDHYHRLEVPDVGTMQWCCSETDDRHWRRSRLDLMTECPIKSGGDSHE
jgi:hypothetical protein